MAIVRLQDVNKTYISERGHRLEVLANIGLQIEAQQFVCLLGASGCGKSTLLNLMAGLLQPSTGAIEVLGKPLTRPIREAQMVFQEYSLLPWRDILDNVGLSLEIQGVKKSLRRQKARELLDVLGLGDFAHHYPHELSGGMRQRAAIARALTTEPQLLYMDEPFGALDAHTRLLMQQELLNYWLFKKRTVVFVTHSIEEAVFLANRIVVLGGRPGKIIEDMPLSLTHPRNRWSKEFGDYCQHLMGLLGAGEVMPVSELQAAIKPPTRYRQKGCC